MPDESVTAAQRRVIARIDFAVELAVPPRIVRAARIAAWLRHLAAIIEGGDSPLDPAPERVGAREPG